MNKYSEKEHIDITRLPAGTRIVIDTIDENLELEVGTPSLAVVLVGSNRRFEGRDKVVLVGSMDKETTYRHTICYRCKLVFMDRTMTHRIFTKPVLRARVVGKNYEYEMWDDSC